MLQELIKGRDESEEDRILGLAHGLTEQLWPLLAKDPRFSCGLISHPLLTYVLLIQGLQKCLNQAWLPLARPGRSRCC